MVSLHVVQNLPALPRRPPSVEEAQWGALTRWVHIFSWLTLAGVAWGVALSHKELVTGTAWTTCQQAGAGCPLAIHLFGVPLLSYLVFMALYGLRELTRATVRRYFLLVCFGSVIELVFSAFEILLMIDAAQQGSPPLEQVLFASQVSLLLVGAGFGLFIQVRVNAYLYPLLDLRFEHPRTEKELIALVKRARSQGGQLRVRGSEHSVYHAIYTDEGDHHINVQLDRYNRILAWDTRRMRVTVQAGCHLGVDPHNPLSSKKNSLLWQLEARGWALPDLGGITHQTVGGFLSTGSMGGTTQYDLGESIVGIRIIDGTGQVHDLAPNPSDPNDEQTNPFYAAGVSMGLLGIVSSVTLQCVPRYDIIGEQITSSTADCHVRLFESGEGDLRHHLERTPFTRLLWWPQRGVDKVQVWEARHTRPEDHVKTHQNGRFVRRPFVSVRGGLFSQRVFIQPFYNLISHDRLPYTQATENLVRNFLKTFLGDERQEFWDSWLEGLPMDDQISDEFMPTEFTELFIDISKTGEVVRALREFYAGDEGMMRTGPYACELYAGRKSRFWMSPSHGRNCVRVDVFWFRTSKDNPDSDFYPQYWEALKRFDFRFHWGKYMSQPDSSTGVEYLRRQYPMWDKFMELRQRMDPDGIFLSAYWKQHLGIDSARAAQPAEAKAGLRRVG